MDKNAKATISQEKAREMQAAILEGQYDFGSKGQINIKLPKHGVTESHGQFKKRTRAFADDLISSFGLDPKTVFAQESRIVITDPQISMPYVLAKLEIPVEWESFAKYVAARIPESPPNVNAVMVAFIKEKAPDGVGIAAKVRGQRANFNNPVGHLDKLLLQRAIAEDSKIDRG